MFVNWISFLISQNFEEQPGVDKNQDYVQSFNYTCFIHVPFKLTYLFLFIYLLTSTQQVVNISK